MNEEYKENLKQCCLHRWDGTFDKQDFARRVVNAELAGKTLSAELNFLSWEEESNLIEELVLELLSKR